MKIIKTKYLFDLEIKATDVMEKTSSEVWSKFVSSFIFVSSLN